MKKETFGRDVIAAILMKLSAVWQVAAVLE